MQLNSNQRMKKKLLTLFLPMMAFACLFSACSDDDDLSSVQPITYSLPAQMKVDTEDCEPVLIKSEAEFNTLFGAYKDHMGWVDFSQYDLVYMQGNTGIGQKIKTIKSWIDTSVYPYQLHVHTDCATIDGRLEKERWAVAYLLPKSDSNNVVCDIKIYAY